MAPESLEVQINKNYHFSTSVYSPVLDDYMKFIGLRFRKQYDENYDGMDSLLAYYKSKDETEKLTETSDYFNNLDRDQGLILRRFF